MTSKDKHRARLGSEVSTPETKVDPQLSACADDGLPPQGLPETQADPSSNTARLAIGQLLGGRYRIERELGEGGMGVVYLAADEQVPGERFAIKVLKRELHPEALTLLREEVRKTRKVSHQNIVDVHSVNVDGQRLYVLMEYLEGKSLDVLLAEEFGRGMSFGRAWPIIEDVGAALGIAHDHNVIHSDIKPANVFLTTAGRTKLLDFGIARVSRGPLLQARPGLRALTPAYASCELLQGKEADRRDDIFSFACVIYEMLCGERPFGELTALEARGANAKPAPLAVLSGEQNAALTQALAFDRERRTASVEKLLEALAAEHRSRTSRVALLGVAAAVLAAVGLTYLALDRLWVSRHSVVVSGGSANTQQATAVATGPATATLDVLQDSIAVLPFVNISGDPKQEYFADGLTEELIDHLVQGTDMKVIARTSSFQFKGRNVDVRSIAHQLAVTHVLEGSVRTDHRQLRVTAQLIRASDGVSLWSHTYDGAVVEIFKVQDEIAGQVSQALRVALHTPRAGDQPPDIQAYNLVLEGNYFKARRTLPDVEKAIQLYHQAIDINPRYALAWARLGSAYLSEELMKGQPSQDQSGRIVAALDKAVRLDPNLAWAYFTRAGFAMNITWDWAAALADTRRIREIDPRFDLLPKAFGDLALTFGDADRAVESYETYLERNPLDQSAQYALTDALCAANRLPQCLETSLRLLQLHPDWGGVNRYVGLARLYLGQVDAALVAMQREPDEKYRLAGLAMVYAAMGRPAESDAALRPLVEKFSAGDAYGIAQVHAYRGDIDEAFRWLDRAYRDHNFGLVGLQADPLLRKLHGDQRFQALLGRMGLTGLRQPVDIPM